MKKRISSYLRSGSGPGLTTCTALTMRFSLRMSIIVLSEEPLQRQPPLLSQPRQRKNPSQPEKRAFRWLVLEEDFADNLLYCLYVHV